MPRLREQRMAVWRFGARPYMVYKLQLALYTSQVTLPGE